MPEQEKQKRLWNVGLGAGLLGAILLALRYAVRRPTSTPVPDTISPKIFTTKVLHTSRFPIVYHESGAGQPVIFVHNVCLGGSSYEWSKVYPEFAATHRVIALDLIGFGESARPNVQLSAADYVRILAEFIRATCRDDSSGVDRERPRGGVLHLPGKPAPGNGVAIDPADTDGVE